MSIESFHRTNLKQRLNITIDFLYLYNHTYLPYNNKLRPIRVYQFEVSMEFLFSTGLISLMVAIVRRQLGCYWDQRNGYLDRAVTTLQRLKEPA